MWIFSIPTCFSLLSEISRDSLLLSQTIGKEGFHHCQRYWEIGLEKCFFLWGKEVDIKNKESKQFSCTKTWAKRWKEASEFVFQGKLLMGYVIILPGLWWADMFQPWGKGIGITHCSWLVSCLEQVHGFWPVSTELLKPPLKKSLHLALLRKIVGRLIGEEEGWWTQALKTLKVRFWYVVPFKKK